MRAYPVPRLSEGMNSTTCDVPDAHRASNQHNRKSIFAKIPAGTAAVFGPPHAANLVPTCSENLHGKLSRAQQIKGFTYRQNAVRKTCGFRTPGFAPRVARFPPYRSPRGTATCNVSRLLRDARLSRREDDCWDSPFLVLSKSTTSVVKIEPPEVSASASQPRRQHLRSPPAQHCRAFYTPLARAVLHPQ